MKKYLLSRSPCITYAMLPHESTNQPCFSLILVHRVSVSYTLQELCSLAQIVETVSAVELPIRLPAPSNLCRGGCSSLKNSFAANNPHFRCNLYITSHGITTQFCDLCHVLYSKALLKGLHFSIRARLQDFPCPRATVSAKAGDRAADRGTSPGCALLAHRLSRPRLCPAPRLVCRQRANAHRPVRREGRTVSA